jgi:hypothetical protein
MSAAELLGRTTAGVESPEQPTGAIARRLVVTWQHPTARGIEPVGFLSFDGNDYEFHYIRNALNVLDFRPLVGFSDLHRSYQSDELFALFAQRAMDPRRPDYGRYVTRLGLPEDTTPWEQIARSGGRREGDTLQLFPEPDVVGRALSCAFLVHGVRWIGQRSITINGRPTTVTRPDLEDALGALHAGDELRLINEPDNPSNSAAVLVATHSNIPVGYVPNLLVEDLHRLQQVAPVNVTVDVVNGPDAPWHMRLLARLSAQNIDNFEFFKGDRWQSLA